VASADTVVAFLSVLTVVGQVGLILLLILWGIGRWKNTQTHLFSAMLVVSLIATLGSLFFSEIAEWVPCKLCWFQRIAMYPQVVVSAMALWRKNWEAAWTTLTLSLIGIVISILHYSEQVQLALHPLSPDALVACDPTGISCAEAPFFHFGYITIPMMAGTVFLLIILLSIKVLRVQK
jgi:disulfide bond formation protein DsbB